MDLRTGSWNGTHLYVGALLYMEWISSKVLLYGTENYVQYPMINHNGKEYFLKCIGSFPGGAVVENLPANAGDTGSSPGLGRSHMPRNN